MEDDFIERLYAEHYKQLLRYAEKSLFGGHRAPDLVQDAFVIAFDKRAELEQHPNPAGWLMNTLKGLITNEYKARARAARRFLPLPADFGADPSSESDALLFEIRDMFTPDEWMLIKAVYIDGYSAVELSRMLGIGYEACKKRIQKAFSKLREQFGSDNDTS